MALSPLEKDPEALAAEVIGCLANDEEGDSELEDDDGDFDEEFVDKLIKKYL